MGGLQRFARDGAVGANVVGICVGSVGADGNTASLPFRTSIGSTPILAAIFITTLPQCSSWFDLTQNNSGNRGMSCGIALHFSTSRSTRCRRRARTGREDGPSGLLSYCRDDAADDGMTAIRSVSIVGQDKRTMTVSANRRFLQANT
jgi:hypothetical protein